MDHSLEDKKYDIRMVNRRDVVFCDLSQLRFGSALEVDINKFSKAFYTGKTCFKFVLLFVFV